MKIVRQGDVLIVPTKKIPESAVAVGAEKGRYILAHGEATGHHHSIALHPRIAMFRDDGSGGSLFIKVQDEPVSLEHQEHSALTIEPGDYEVRIQRTFSGERVQRVVD